MREVVDLCLEREGVFELDIDPEETSQPVCLTDKQSEVEVVLRLTDRWQTW